MMPSPNLNAEEIALCERLRSLKLSGMADALEAQLMDPNADLVPFMERFSTIVNQEWQIRYNKKFSKFMKKAQLRYPDAALDETIYDLLESDGNGQKMGVRTFFWTYLRYFLNFSASISMEKVGPKMSSSTIPIADVESISSPEFVSKTWISISSSFGYARSRVIKSPTFILLFLRIHYLAQAQAAPVFQRTHPIEGLFDAVLIVPMKVRI